MLAIRRVRVWPGGSKFGSVGTERKPPDRKASVACGQTGVTGDRALTAENVSYSRSARRQSSYREITQ